MNFFKDWDFLFPTWKKVVGIKTSKSFLSFLPRISTRFEGFVIDPPAQINPLTQRSSLSLGGIETIFKSLNKHPTIGYLILKALRLQFTLI